MSDRPLPLDYNISTYGAAGNGRDYTALGTWESDTDIDLVTATKGEVLECYADSASFTDHVDIGGATTDTDYFRVIKPASGEEHTGIPETGVYFMYNNSSSLIGTTENYAAVYNLCIKNTSTGASYFGGIAFHGHGTAIGNILYKCTEPNGGNGVGIGSGTGGVTNYTVRNNLFIECDHGLFHWRVGGTNVIDNNTAVNCTRNGMYARSAITATNCISQGNGTNFTNITQVTCATVGVVFTDAANDDFSLDASDTVATGTGTDRSALFDQDILRNTRTVPWDIGAFAAPVAASTTGLIGNLISDTVGDLVS